MLIIFCSDPFDRRQPDAAFAAEANAVQTLGIANSLINYEALVDDNDPSRAVRRVEMQRDTTLGLYRGWMLRPAHYRRLFTALAEHNVYLINDPAEHQHAHYLPESFDIIRDHTPDSVWLRTDMHVSMDRVMDLLRPFGMKPIILKDFVKSQKHYWEEACYIPSASDRQAVERVVRRFLVLQGPDLKEGLVFREYVELEPLAVHTKSLMPLTKEYRVFYLDGEPIYTVEYWDEGDYEGTTPPPGLFRDIARAVRSRFFAMDLAQRRDGEWIIVELGDGQVAGLPEPTDLREFYTAVKDHWPPAERHQVVVR
jgi:ATP-grasp domain, R2K clade family 3